jgi:hypothetical protein
VSRARETPQPEMLRPALLPGLLSAIAAVIGIFLIGSDLYFAVRLLLSILACIIAVFAVQGRAWWWLPVLGAIVVLWNPVAPFEFAGPLWSAAHILAAGALLAVGLFLKVPERP